MHPAPDIVCKRFSAEFSPFPWLYFYYSRYLLWFPCGIPAEKSEPFLFLMNIQKLLIGLFVVLYAHKTSQKQPERKISACIFRRKSRRFLFQGKKRTDHY